MRYLFDAIYAIALLLYSPLILWRMAVLGKWRRGWAERFGAVPRQAVGRRAIWIHAVSVGEANATVTLVDALRRELPDHDIVFSATTDTGYARLGKLHPDAPRFHYPLDLSFAVARAFRRLRPALIILMELELWPNLLRMARARGIPVVVANGRISDRAMPRYQRWRRLIEPMFRRLTAACAQDDLWAGRFVELGASAERVHVTGSLKYDTAALADHVDGAETLAVAMGIDRDRPLWVAGSTGPGEEAMLLDAHRTLAESHPNLQLAIIPRKPERFDEVADLISGAGYRCVRRTQSPDSGQAPSVATGVFLGDTMGELRKFYDLADVIFVGRSLVPMGGSDVIEAAAPGRAVVTGPHTANFAEPVRRLSSAGGLRVVSDRAELVAAVDELLTQPERRDQMSAAARETIVTARGATDRTVAVICDILSGRTPR
jgi:3-deoxy-D-manno-octulosonic-acid transferase